MASGLYCELGALSVEKVVISPKGFLDDGRRVSRDGGWRARKAMQIIGREAEERCRATLTVGDPYKSVEDVLCGDVSLNVVGHDVPAEPDAGLRITAGDLQRLLGEPDRVLVVFKSDPLGEFFGVCVRFGEVVEPDCLIRGDGSRAHGIIDEIFDRPDSCKDDATAPPRRAG